MTVPVKTGTSLVPGDAVTFVTPTAGGAVAAKAGAAPNFISGYGVVIHEGSAAPAGETAADTDSGRLVQIATGNAYVAMRTGGNIDPFGIVTTDADSNIIKITGIGSTVVTAIAFIKGVLGRSYGAPGEMVNPGRVAGTSIAVVRLGQ